MSFRRKFLVAVTALFFASMFVLSQTAETAHNGALPHVTAEILSQEQFPYEYTDDSGETAVGTRSAPAIRTELLENDIYVIYQREKNGKMRDFVQLAEIEKGAEHNGFTEIIPGPVYGKNIVTSSDAELHDGCEVCVIPTPFPCL